MFKGNFKFSKSNKAKNETKVKRGRPANKLVIDSDSDISINQFDEMDGIL